MVNSNQPEEILKLKANLNFVPVREDDSLRYLVECSDSGRFLRVGQREYLIAVALDGKRTLAQAVQKARESASHLNWTEEFVRDCLAWLLRSGLVTKSNPSTAQQNAQPLSPDQSAASKVWDPLSFRLTLIKEERIAAWLQPIANRLDQTKLWAALAILAIAGVMLVTYFQSLRGLAAELFVPESKFWWLFAWIVLKFAHETGHALAALRIGSSVRNAGVMFFCFAPVPFVDVSDIWRVPKRRDRIACSIAGMAAEILLSAIAIIICCFSSNPSVQFGCISVATLGTITTLLFNANPLMRYDGYYVLSDLLNRPNLWSEATAAIQTRCASLFGVGSTPISGSVLDATYGFATQIYRFVLLGTMAWGAIAIWQGVGCLIVIFAFSTWILLPKLRAKAQRKQIELAQAVFMANQPNRNGAPTEKAKSFFRIRRVWPWLVGGTTAIVIAGIMDTPIARYAPGVVRYSDPAMLRPEISGVVEEFYVSDNTPVQIGDPIVRLSNPGLIRDIQKKRIELLEANENATRLASENRIAEMQAEQARGLAITKELEVLEGQSSSLILRSPANGTFISEQSMRSIGRYVVANDVLGVVADLDRIEVEVSVSQQDIERHSSLMQEGSESKEREMVVCLSNGNTLKGELVHVSPKASDAVIDPVLTAVYGGPISVRQVYDSTGKEEFKTEQPRFSARISLPNSTLAKQSVGTICSCRPSQSNESLLEFAKAWITGLIRWADPARIH